MCSRGQFDAPHSVRVVRGVTIQSYLVDHNDWAWQSFVNLFPEIANPECNPGHDIVIARALGKVLNDFPDCYCPNLFVNPAFAVTAENASKTFMRESRVAQRTWLAITRDILGTAAVRRQIRRLREFPITKQLMFTGVLILDGKQVDPACWPDALRKKLIPPGSRFGELVILKALSSGKYVCRCSCGKLQSVREQRLRNGLTRLCRSCEMSGASNETRWGRASDNTFAFAEGRTVNCRHRSAINKLINAGNGRRISNTASRYVGSKE